MLRLLIEDITVERLSNPKRLILHVRWQGGVIEDLHCAVPVRVQDRRRYGEQFVSRIRALAEKHTDVDIAGLLNREGLKSATGNTFTAAVINWIRYKHRIPTPQLKHPGELTVKQVAAKFGVSTGVVY